MNNKKFIAKFCATALLAIHFGNTFCVLAALLIGGVEGGVAGAVGMGLADIMDPIYIVSAPKTILLKFMIGVIVGLIAHKIAHLKKHSDGQKYSMKWAFIASCGGMVFNVFADPIVGFLYKNYILGVPYEAAKIFAAWASVSTLINAVTSVIIATLEAHGLFQVAIFNLSLLFIIPYMYCRYLDW